MTSLPADPWANPLITKGNPWRQVEDPWPCCSCLYGCSSSWPGFPTYVERTPSETPSDPEGNLGGAEGNREEIANTLGCCNTQQRRQGEGPRGSVSAKKEVPAPRRSAAVMLLWGRRDSPGFSRGQVPNCTNLP